MSLPDETQVEFHWSVSLWGEKPRQGSLLARRPSIVAMIGLRQPMGNLLRLWFDRLFYGLAAAKKLRGGHN
ncbi:MAG TPA: hypothetical protein PK867_13875, partial [Pirellulales bacterium]|nr:hypothetical protein [Pirellulales bacterium]